MKALHIYGKQDIRVTSETPAPIVVNDNDVLLEVAFCGICGTDLHEYMSGPIFGPKPGEVHPYSGIELPVCMGHEFAGTVVNVGAKVTKVKKGDRICVDVSYGCAEQDVDALCSACEKDSPNACSRLCLRGLSAESGGLCQFTVIPEHAVHILPDNVPLDIGAMVQPMSISWHAVSISGIQPGDSALVIGAGPIGIACILALQGHGASNIIVSEPASIRREQALALGATHVVDPMAYPSVDDLVAAIRKLTPNDNFEGVNYSFDTSGIQQTLDTAIDALKFRGTAVNLAIWSPEKPAVLHPMRLTAQEKRYMGSMGLTGQDMAEVIAAFSNGSMSMAKARTMITSKIHLDDAVEEGFHQLLNNKDKHIKILIAPNGIVDGIPPNEIEEHLPHGIDVVTWQSQFKDRAILDQE